MSWVQLKTAFLVILPAAAPTILTGMRISIGIAWLVIVAAEMLVGGTGIGYYVWNEWNNLDLTSVIFSILMIGVVGMLLDTVFAYIQRAFSSRNRAGSKPERGNIVTKPFIEISRPVKALSRSEGAASH